MKKVKVLTEAISQQFHEYEVEVPEDWDLDNLSETNYEFLKKKILKLDKRASYEKFTNEQFCQVKDLRDPESQKEPPQFVNIEVENVYNNAPIFKIHNYSPTYLKANNIITKEVADTLIALVNERGKNTEWSYNPNCLEYQIANPFSPKRNIDDEKIVPILSSLFGIADIGLRHINWGLKNSAFELVTGHHGFWVLRYELGGTFEAHCDQGSDHGSINPTVMATMSILLNDDFEGGDLILYNSNGDPAYVDSEKQKYSATIWDGLTYHKATPVTKGYRYVLIIHYVGNPK